ALPIFFSGLVDRGTTVMKSSPSMRAKYASETAVEPLEASTSVVPSWMRPLTRPYSSSERARRCLSEPVGCTDSSLRYRSMPQLAGRGKVCRCVSALRLASASSRAIAVLVQEVTVRAYPAALTGRAPVAPLGRGSDGSAPDAAGGRCAALSVHMQKGGLGLLLTQLELEPRPVTAVIRHEVLHRAVVGVT